MDESDFQVIVQNDNADAEQAQARAARQVNYLKRSRTSATGDWRPPKRHRMDALKGLFYNHAQAATFSLALVSPPRIQCICSGWPEELHF
jgi:hypothetical protein